MARTAQVRYFPSRGAFYCQLNGKQYCLGKGPDDSPKGPTYLRAVSEYARLACYNGREEAGADLTVRTVASMYLDALSGNGQSGTIRFRRPYLAALVAKWGDLRLVALRTQHLDTVAAEQRIPHPGQRGKPHCWGDPSVRSFRVTCKALCGWAKRDRLIPTNPLDGLSIPAAQTRARERLIEPDEHARLMSDKFVQRSDTYRRLLLTLENTGARPGELRHATVGDWNEAWGAIVFYADGRRKEGEFRHKTARCGTDRVIYLSGEALATMREYVAGKKASHPLFPVQGGRQMTRWALISFFGDLRKRVGLPHVVPYAYRHTFATEFLLRGGSVDILATLMGNSPQTIREHYSHLLTRHSEMRGFLEAFKGTNPVP